MRLSPMLVTSVGVLLAGSVSSAGLHAETVFKSGPSRVALIELYTSEGCSSCPPAEKWLGELRTDAGLWSAFVPVAFHVNYWDRLGWRDALSTKEYTNREYAHAAVWKASSVYTPCFVRDGEEWRPRGRPVDAVPVAAAGELMVTRADGDVYNAVFVAAVDAKNLPDALDVSVALLGGGIVSSVRAGENAGRELTHEFVVLQLTTAALKRGAGGRFSAEVAVSVSPDRKLPKLTRRAVAVWVTPQGVLAPLQATGGWLE